MLLPRDMVREIFGQTIELVELAKSKKGAHPAIVLPCFLLFPFFRKTNIMDSLVVLLLLLLYC
jgi:hypothetical protein